MTNAGDAEYFASLTGDRRPVCEMAREVLSLRERVASLEGELRGLVDAVDDALNYVDDRHERKTLRDAAAKAEAALTAKETR